MQMLNTFANFTYSVWIALDAISTILSGCIELEESRLKQLLQQDWYNMLWETICGLQTLPSECFPAAFYLQDTKF